jgi:hypothetical protein
MGPHATPTTESSEMQKAGDPHWDVEQEWAEMRARSGLEPHREFYDGERSGPAFEASLAPSILLYTGFFLGPIATFLVAMLLLVCRPTLRQLLIMSSVAVAGWLLVQGITYGVADSWSTTLLQVARSGVNMGVGVFLLLYVRSITPGDLVTTRRSLAQSLGAGALFVVLFFMLDSEFLVWLGR